MAVDVLLKFWQTNETFSPTVRQSIRNIAILVGFVSRCHCKNLT